MVQFQPFSTKVEVKGEAVLAVVAGMRFFEDRARAILGHNGITDPRPGKWYRQQLFLNAFKTIAEAIGPHALYSIGTKIPETAQFPERILSLEEALASIDTAYHLNHRGGEIGSYSFVKEDDGSLWMICTNPYPCEFDRGIIEGMSRNFLPEGYTSVTVVHDDARPCREKGADSCTYQIILS